MALVEMIMPKMGESIMEATILTWLKKEGDVIEQDESVLEVATDKVDTEVPATHGGILKEILIKEGEVVEVGKPIAVITTDLESDNGSPSSSANVKEEPVATVVAAPVSVPVPVPVEQKEVLTVSNGSSKTEPVTPGRFYSPLVLNIARKEQIAMPELEQLPGSGKEGRVTKKDILSYVKTRKDQPAVPFIKTTTAPTTPLVSVSVSGEDEIIEMDRMRRMIAERMVDSKRTSPHVTSFVEADVTNIVAWTLKSVKAKKLRLRLFSLKRLLWPSGISQ